MLRLKCLAAAAFLFALVAFASQTLAGAPTTPNFVIIFIGAELPQHKIDGHDILPLITGRPGAKTPWPVMYLYHGERLFGVRNAGWKLIFPHTYEHVPVDEDGIGCGPSVMQETGLGLYDVKNDISETKDVRDQHPEIVKELEVAAELARQDRGDTLTGYRNPSGVRPHSDYQPHQEKP